LALQANGNASKGERERRERELSLLANRVLARAVRCDGLANDLKRASRSSAVLAGGYGGSRQKLVEESVNEAQRGIGEMQAAARAVLDSEIRKLSDDGIAETLMKLDGHITHLERVHEKFLLDLGSVQAEARHLQTMMK
jgi:hypothetical protein